MLQTGSGRNLSNTKRGRKCVKHYSWAAYSPQDASPSLLFLHHILSENQTHEGPSRPQAQPSPIRLHYKDSLRVWTNSQSENACNGITAASQSTGKHCLNAATFHFMRNTRGYRNSTQLGTSKTSSRTPTPLRVSALNCKTVPITLYRRQEHSKRFMV